MVSLSIKSLKIIITKSEEDNFVPQLVVYYYKYQIELEDKVKKVIMEMKNNNKIILSLVCPQTRNIQIIINNRIIIYF